MRNAEKKLTSVRLDPELYEEFKFQALKDNFSFQKLASRSIYLYINDKEFRQKLQKQLVKQI